MTHPGVPPPPARFPTPTLTILPAGTPLHRTHAKTVRPAQFNPCLGQPSRFAPFNDPSGTCVPTLYAATTQEAAAFESIFHAIAPDLKTWGLERANLIDTSATGELSGGSRRAITRSLNR